MMGTAFLTTALLIAMCSIMVSRTDNRNEILEFFNETLTTTGSSNTTDYTDSSITTNTGSYTTAITTAVYYNCSCQDVGTCFETNSTCKECNDIFADAGYNCTVCIADYEKIDGHCDADECKVPEKYCPGGPVICKNTVGNYSCQCMNGYFLHHSGDNDHGQCVIENILFVAIWFEDMYFTHELLDTKEPEFTSMSHNITKTLDELFRGTLEYYGSQVISIINETVPMAVVNLILSTRLNNGTDIRTELDLYVNNCSATKACFDSHSSVKLQQAGKVLGPCANENVCAVYANTVCNDSIISNGSVQFSCECANGYSGDTSYEVGNGRIFVCTENKVCKNNPCGPDSTCMSSGADYFCTCSDNRTSYVNQPCPQPACLKNPCFNGGVCKSSVGSAYSCDCPWSYSGQNCEKALSLILVVVLTLVTSIALLILARLFYLNNKHKKTGGALLTKPSSYALPSDMAYVNESFDQAEFINTKIPRAKLKNEDSIPEEIADKAF